MTTTSDTASAHSAATAPESSIIEREGVLEIVISEGNGMPALAPNALTEATTALQAIGRGERAIGVVLLRGPGAHFCAGGNVQAFASADDRPAYLRYVAECFHGFVGALVEAQRPVVVAAAGWAAGAGMSLVLQGDLVVAGTSTKMMPAYSALGFSPDGGMSWTLPRVVGATRARHIILTNRKISSAEMLDWGIASEIVDDAEVLDRARALASELAAGSHAALVATKGLLDDSASATLAEQLHAEARSISRLSGTAEGREGVDAFVDKRAADFAAARQRSI